MAAKWAGVGVAAAAVAAADISEAPLVNRDDAENAQGLQSLGVSIYITHALLALKHALSGISRTFPVYARFLHLTRSLIASI